MEPVSFEEAPQKRPVFLLVLCILTFVYTGLSIFSPIAQIVIGTRDSKSLNVELDRVLDAADQMRDSGMGSIAHIYEQIAEMTVEINQHATAVGFINLAIILLGAASAIIMLKGKKIGFHLYIIYSMLQIGAVYFFVSPENVPLFMPIFGGVFSALFIFLYSRNLHWLK